MLFIFSVSFVCFFRCLRILRNYSAWRRWGNMASGFPCSGDTSIGQVMWKPILRIFFSSDRAGYTKQKVWKTKLGKIANPLNLKKWQVMWKPILRKYLSDRGWYNKHIVWKTKPWNIEILWNLKKWQVMWKPILGNFRLTELGIPNKKCEMFFTLFVCNLQFLEI